MTNLPIEIPAPRIRATVLITAKARNPQVPDKDLVGMEMTDLSDMHLKRCERNGVSTSLHQELQTGQRILFSAHCTSVRAWSLRGGLNA